MLTVHETRWQFAVKCERCPSCFTLRPHCPIFNYFFVRGKYFTEYFRASMTNISSTVSFRPEYTLLLIHQVGFSLPWLKPTLWIKQKTLLNMDINFQTFEWDLSHTKPYFSYKTFSLYYKLDFLNGKYTSF